MTTAAQAIKFGLTQVGITESPRNSNHTPYGAWYGQNGEPWCAMFQSWVLHHAGVSNFAIETSKGFAWTVAGVRWFRNHGYWVSSTDAQPGDLIFYDWANNGIPDHVGMLLSNGPTMRVLEGNTGNVSQQNGGEVMIRLRSHDRTCLGAGRMSHFYTASGGAGPKPAKPVSPSRPTWAFDNGHYGHPSTHKNAKVDPHVVRHLQGQLLKHGQNVVTDGVFGDWTEAAVRRVQSHYRLHADGVVGPYTWSALHR
jgi:peptidoglycan hydrolase-like protein with peptidoglycan-binding domain